MAAHTKGNLAEEYGLLVMCHARIPFIMNLMGCEISMRREGQHSRRS